MIYAEGEVTVRTRCEAVTAWLPSAVLSHRTAAWLWNLLPEPVIIEATVPLAEFRRTPTWLHLYRRDLRPDWVGEVWDLPVTKPGRTILDCVGVLPAGEAERLIDESARAAISELREFRSDVWGSAQLRAHLRGAAFDATSEPERLFARALARRGVRMLANHPVGPYFGDFVDERSHTIVEIDGREFHSESHTFCRDRRRQNALQLEGWFVLRYAAADVFTRLDRCVDEVVEVVRRRRKSRRG